MCVLHNMYVEVKHTGKRRNPKGRRTVLIVFAQRCSLLWRKNKHLTAAKIHLTHGWVVCACQCLRRGLPAEQNQQEQGVASNRRPALWHFFVLWNFLLGDCPIGWIVMKRIYHNNNKLGFLTSVWSCLSLAIAEQRIYRIYTRPGQVKAEWKSIM